MSPNGGFWPASSTVFFNFLVPDLLNPVSFFKTRAPQPCSPASSAPAVGSTCHVDRRRPAHGLHAPERPLLFGVREGHAPPFSGRAPWGRGLRWRIYGWVLLVVECVSHAPLSPAENATVSSAGCSVFWFFLLCVGVNSLISHVQSDCVLLRFY